MLRFIPLSRMTHRENWRIYNSNFRLFPCRLHFHISQYLHLPLQLISSTFIKQTLRTSIYHQRQSNSVTMPSCFRSRSIRGSPIDRLVHRLDVYRQKLQNHKVRYPWSHHQTRPRNSHIQDQSETQILPMGDVHLERETERAETSSSDNLCILQPSAMMTAPARGILKPCRSSHTVESMGMISAKSSRHITWARHRSKTLS